MSETAKLEYLPLDEIARWPRNAKRHDIPALKSSIATFGFRTPLLRDERTKRLVAGHGRQEALSEMRREGAPLPVGLKENKGAWFVPVVVGMSFTSDEEAERFVLADNRVQELGGMDDDVLAGMLRDHASALDGTGYSLRDADDIIREHDRLLDTYKVPELPEGEASQDGTDADEDPDDDLQDLPPGPARSRSGEVYTLGRHRLICGDAADPDVIRRFMDGEKVGMIWTDPPYNIASDSKNFAASTSKALGRLKDAEWDKDYDPIPALDNGLSALSPDGTVYVCTSHFLAPVIWQWMSEWADHHSFCGWRKTNPSPSLTKRHWTGDMELVCYATRGKHIFNFPKSGHAPSTWDFSKVTKTGYCPTPKPVKLVMHAIAHSSRRGSTVLDMHAGAGSLLIACEKLGRVACLAEIDPLACDEIRDRWDRWQTRKKG